MKKLWKVYIALIMVFLYAPIVLLVLYSFNDSKSRAKWGGFTLRWYQELFSDKVIISSLGTTLSIGLLAAGEALFLRLDSSLLFRRVVPVYDYGHAYSFLYIIANMV